MVFPPQNARYAAEDNILIGNVAFFGASSGEAYIRGVAGERFCVRNSGVHAVVEGTGDHACEYMTGGRVAVLGNVGRNFAAGMSGGVAYVYDPDGILAVSGNTEMVSYGPLETAAEFAELQGMIEKHVLHTGSTRGRQLLDNWDNSRQAFVRVMPHDYQRMLDTIRRLEAEGLSGEAALMAAFKANNQDLTRASGN